jgi:predicted RND superfamily exporter protein
MADVLRIMSKALNDKNEPGYGKIPQTRDAVAQYLELYSMSGNPDDFERLVDFNFEKAQMMISINNGSTPVVDSLVARIKAETKDDKNVTAIGGYSVVYSELASTIIKGQAQSISIALIAIVILVILLFRSFSAGALAAVPLVISILLNFGAMGFLGLRLDIATAIITSIVMGTGVDFTIQFLWKYRDLRRAGLGWDASVVETLSTTGRAIAFNALCVVSGFVVLIFSSLPPLRHLALLFSILTLACMVSTLVVAPAICLLWKPRFLDPSLQSK